MRPRFRIALAAIATWVYTANFAAADPALDYMLHCQGCHLPDATGVAKLVPALGADLGRIVAVPGGRDYLLRVPGAAHAPISDAALAAVLNWLIDTYSAPTRPRDFVPFNAAEVARARPNPLADPEAWRAQIFEPANY